MSVMRTTAEVYAEIADEYFQVTKDLPSSSSLEENFHPFLSKLAGKKILDAGAGSCRDSLVFLERGFDVEAVDACFELLSISDFFPNRYKRVMDVRQLAYTDGTFNGIWCNAVLLHLNQEDISVSLLEFYRVLKPKGILFVSVKEGRGTESIPFSGTSASRTFYYYQLEEMREFLYDAGFKILKSWRKLGADSDNAATTWLKILASR